MTLEELYTLSSGETVVITLVDANLCKFHKYEIGDELIFNDINQEFVNLIRVDDNHGWVVVHFTHEICDYIDRKTKIQRNKKLEQIFEK